MEFSVDKDTLARSMSVVMRAVPAKSPMPVLTNVLIEAGPERLTLTTFNGEMSIKTTLPATVRKAGSVTIPAKLFNDLAALYRSGPVDFKLDAHNLHLHFNQGATKNNLAGIAADDYPQLSQGQGYRDVATVGAAALREAISQTVIAASADVTKPVLMGLEVVVREGGMRLAAADSFRVAIRVVGLPPGAVKNPATFIVPARAMAELARILPDNETEVALKTNNNDSQLVFSCGDTTVTATLIEGKFPAVVQFVPREHATTVIIDKAELSRAIRQMAIYLSEETSNGSGNGKASVRLIFSGAEAGGIGTVRVTAMVVGVGDGFSDLEADFEGIPNKTALNLGYILNVLNEINTPRVLIRLLNSQKPCLFRPEGDESYNYVIMPVLLNAGSDDDIPLITARRTAEPAAPPEAEAAPEAELDADPEPEAEAGPAPEPEAGDDIPLIPVFSGDMGF
jgi:DNA polymerase-3 subunit beta